MNTSTRQMRAPFPWLMLLGLIAISVGQACQAQDPMMPAALNQLIGLSEADLRAKHPEVKPLTNSFKLLVSKNLYPYQPPEDHKLLRLGDRYIVLELQDGTVIKIHKVRG